jgi:hypothetical protein
MQQPIKEERKEKEEGRRKKEEGRRKKKKKEEGTAQGLAGAHLAGSRQRSPCRISLGLAGDPRFVFLFFFPAVALTASPHRRRPWFFLGFRMIKSQKG